MHMLCKLLGINIIEFLSLKFCSLHNDRVSVVALVNNLTEIMENHRYWVLHHHLQWESVYHWCFSSTGLGLAKWVLRLYMYMLTNLPESLSASRPPTGAIRDKQGFIQHYNDVRMSAMASQITSLTIVYSTVYSGAHQRKHQSFASLAFVRGIHRWSVNSPHKGLVTRKMFPFHDDIMNNAIPDVVLRRHSLLEIVAWMSNTCVIFAVYSSIH